jgi:hypothetical protein
LNYNSENLDELFPDFKFPEQDYSDEFSFANLKESQKLSKRSTNRSILSADSNRSENVASTRANMRSPVSRYESLLSRNKKLSHEVTTRI